MLSVLLVDDSEDDVTLTREALKDGKLELNLRVASDGQKALNMLQNDLPNLIILDINMPGMNGLEVLRRIKHDPRMVKVPIVMLTTSQIEADILKAYLEGASAYVCKPLNFDRFCEIVRKLREFYFEIAMLPK